jgi:peptide/nickel transport system permease protein
MATIATPLKGKAKAKKIEDVGQIPQWQLMVRRFRKSKLSVAALIVIILLYLLAMFSDFLAPYKHDELDTNFTFAAPSRIVSAPGGGLGIVGLKQELNQELFKYEYKEDPGVVYPIKFFVQGYRYDVLGFIPVTTHLFGIDVPPNNDPAAPKPKFFLWGADREGRDLFSRVMKGSQISMTVGFIAVVLQVVLGTLIGTASGYFGGRTDNIVQRVVELFQSFPELPLFLALAAGLPLNVSIIQRLLLITVIIGLVRWTGLSREVRGKVLSFRNSDYTNAAKAAGASDWHIITNHMVPNVLSHVVVVAMLSIPAAIGIETALSFLGLGVQPPYVSWGLLLQGASNIQAIKTYPWQLIPVGVLLVLVLAFNLLGDGVRDAVDPYA